MTKFTTEERNMIIRVVNRLRSKPYYMQLTVMAIIWGVSKRWITDNSSLARGLAV